MAIRSTRCLMGLSVSVWGRNTVVREPNLVVMAIWKSRINSRIWQLKSMKEFVAIIKWIVIPRFSILVAVWDQMCFSRMYLWLAELMKMTWGSCGMDLPERRKPLCSLIILTVQVNSDVGSCYQFLLEKNRNIFVTISTIFRMKSRSSGRRRTGVVMQHMKSF